MMYETYDERIRRNRAERIQRSQSRARKVRRTRFVFVTVIVLLMVMIASLLFNPAAAETDIQKQDYPVYTVEENDTLWDIAKKYTDSDKDVRETIYEITEANGISENDNLNVGETLIIPVD